MAMVVLGLGCGRIGYQPLVDGARDGGAETGAASDVGTGEPPPAPGDGGVQPSDLRDGGPAAEVSAPIDGAGVPADTAVSPDSAARPDTGVPDTSVAPDRAPDLDTAVSPADVAEVGTPGTCPAGSSNEVFADFEDGTINSNPMGTLGGTPFLLIGQAAATVTNQAHSFCGRRALAVTRIGPPSPAVLVQSRWMTEAGDGSTRWFDARPYRGLMIVMAASAPIEVRVKLPNRDTINNGYDHFQLRVNVGPGWIAVSPDWRVFQQTGTGSSTQFPTFDLSQLFAVEFSAPLPAGATFWVDEIALIR